MDAEAAKHEAEDNAKFVADLEALKMRLKQKKDEDFFSDDHEFDTQLERMGCDLSEYKWQQYVRRQPQVNRDLGTVN